MTGIKGGCYFLGLPCRCASRNDGAGFGVLRNDDVAVGYVAIAAVFAHIQLRYEIINLRLVSASSI